MYLIKKVALFLVNSIANCACRRFSPKEFVHRPAAVKKFLHKQRAPKQYSCQLKIPLPHLFFSGPSLKVILSLIDPPGQNSVKIGDLKFCSRNVEALKHS